MLTHSLLARISGSPAEAYTWAHEAAALVSRKTGVKINVSSRLGGPPEIMWISQHDDLPSFQKAQAVAGSDADCARMLEGAREKHLFDATSIDTAFWLPI